MARPRGSIDFGEILRAAEAASPVDALDAVTRELGDHYGAFAVSLMVMDSSGRALARLAHVGADEAELDKTGPSDDSNERRTKGESATLVRLDEGPHEQALRTQEVQVVAPKDPTTEASRADGWQVVAPVTERGETIGALELALPEEPDEETTADIARIAHLLAFIVIADRRHTDLFEWGQRSSTFSLSAEIQQRLLPGAHTCEAAAFTLSAWLEPAATIGGDTFDYVLDRDILHVSLTDAMGHGIGAALTATVCTASLRNTRRRGATLIEQVNETNGAVADHAESRNTDEFLTGLVGRLDLASGSLALINAGHVRPYLARGTEVTELELPADLPIGMFRETTYGSSELMLEPNDRLVFVTDGMLERNVTSVDMREAIAESRDLHPREAVRWLADSALTAAGHALQDDAAVLCLDWRGDNTVEREADTGADPVQASDPL